MKKCAMTMAVAVPVGQLADGEEVLCTQVWGQVSSLLLPALLHREVEPDAYI